MKLNGRRIAFLTGAIFLFFVAAGLYLNSSPKPLEAQTTYTIGQPSLTVTAGATSFACNWAVSSVCRVAVNATVGATPVFLNPVDGGSYVLELVQDSVGHPVPLPVGVVNAGGTVQATATALANNANYLLMQYVASPLSTASPIYIAK